MGYYALFKSSLELNFQVVADTHTDRPRETEKANLKFWKAGQMSVFAWENPFNWISVRSVFSSCFGFLTFIFFSIMFITDRIASGRSGVHETLLHLVNNEQANKINHDNNDVEMLAILYLRLYAMASGLFRIGYLMTQPVALDRIA